MPRRPARPRTASAVAALLLGVTLLAGCGPQEEETKPSIEVTGEFGRRPQVAFEPPLQVEAPETEVLIEGEGKPLDDGDPALLAYVAFSATTGEVVDESYAREPRSLTLTPDAAPLYEELLGQNEGTRLLHLSQGTVSRPEPVVVVYDVLHTQAWGEETTPPEDADALPRVERDNAGRPTITIPEADPPSQLRVITLIKGEGPQVEEGGLLTAHYTSVAWETGDEFDSTWGEKLAPPAIPFTGLIPAWQEGLSGATVGSQIMIIAPPAAAFGSDTVVFIIDLLATTKPEGNTNEPADPNHSLP